MLRRALAALLLFVPTGLVGASCSSEAPDDDLPKPLPAIQGVELAEDLNPDPAVVEVELRASAFEDTLGGDTMLALYGYDGMAPGPLIQARQGDEIVVHFTNDLPQATTIHWHGLRISDQMDGTPRVQDPVQPGESFEYRFVAKDAGTFWYHPHVRGHEQVERGLYGPLVIHASDDPVYDAERFFLLDDILLAGDGSIAPFSLGSHMVQMHGRLGNALLTNGQLDEPVQIDVIDGHVERWRLLNPSNARTMKISLSSGKLRVIGTDGGRLAEPYETERLTIAVGQRYDVEVRFTGTEPVELLTHVLTLDANDNVVEIALPVVHANVTAPEAPIEGREIVWPVSEPEAPRTPGQLAVIEFNAVSTPKGLEWQLNGEANRMEPLFTFEEGQTIPIALVNKAGPEHPFHLHGQFFRVTSGNQPGLKDTVLVPGNSRVDIEAYMDNPGRWMLHCHILEHAELGMMAELLIEAKAAAGQ